MMSVGTTEAFMRALSNVQNLQMEPPTIGEEHMKAYQLIEKEYSGALADYTSL